MCKKTKFWLIASACLIIFGGIIFSIAGFLVGWDFSKLSTAKKEANSYEITQEFSDIKIETNSANIEFLPSTDGKTKLVCYENVKQKHVASVVDGVLTVCVINEYKWYDYVGLDFSSPKITFYLVQTEYDKLLIKTDTGDINIPKEFSFNSIEVSVDTGEVNSSALVSEDIKISISTGSTILTDVNCKNLYITGSTGDVFIKGVIVSEKTFIKLSTGDVEIQDCDGKEIYIETSTGDVTGNLLSEKVFTAKTSTGKIEVPNTTTGGICEITTSTGDVKITI